VRRTFLIPVIALLLGPAQAQTASLGASDDEVLLRVSATGVQVYECRSAMGASPTWAFNEPRADLFSAGRPVGRHFAGPTWEHTDGSRIVGKVVANAPAARPEDIPWLRLIATSQAGEGAFSRVTVVQRIDTKGGVLAGACPSLGAVSEVPYTADYVMIRAAP